VNVLSNVLIVSSLNARIRELIDCLRQDGFNTTIETFDKVNNSPELFKTHNIILFHTEYAESTNIQIIKYLRKSSKWPVYALTTHEDTEIVKKYLIAGVEGFLPLRMSCDLIAHKIRAVIRYINDHVYKTNEILEISGITIDLNNRLIITKSKKYKLTLNEYQIIKVLVSEKNRVVSKDELISRIWDHHNSATDNALGIHISRLRKKTVSDENVQIIETIWGVGYRLNTTIA
jgi:DNA-binding response OmpR family regulator